jgi:hypothetical protein
MTQSQHTQGLSYWSRHNGSQCRPTKNQKEINACPSNVCTCYAQAVREDEAANISNAHLIAAAPELLETLTYLKARLSEMVADELPALLEEGPTSELILSRLDSYTAKIDDVISKAKGETC